MKKSFIALPIIIIIIITTGITLGASSVNPSGNISLQNNKTVTFYKKNDHGVLKYVVGKLSQSVDLGNEVAVSYEFFETNKEAFKMINPSKELVVHRLEKDYLGMTHIRFNQLYNGLKVIGGELITHYNTQGILNTVNGNYIDGINLDVQPDISSQNALDIAQSDLESFFGTGTPDNPELVIFPWEGQNYLCWRLFLLSETPMGRWEYFIDAKTADIIYKANRIMNEDAIGTGIGVMGNVYDHIDTDYNGSLYYMKDYTRQANNDLHGHNGQMANGNYIETSVAEYSLPGVVATDADNVWTNSNQASSVDGHMYTLLFYDWLLSQLNRNSYTNNGSSMKVTVDYAAEGANNAYWNGSRIVIWSWSVNFRSLAGCPDVVAHEWGHAVTNYCSNLIYQKEPGALNESFSDMLGAAFEFAHPQYDYPDWYMAENGMVYGNGFRSMSDPHEFNDPDTYGPSDPYWVNVENCTPSGGNDWCGVHTNSGVGNKWFFLLSDGGVHNGVTVDGIGAANAIKVAYHANAYYWTSTSNYHDAALGTLSAAYDVDSTNLWAIQASLAWNAVGVDAPNLQINFSSDPSSGWVPFNVNFSGFSALDVINWTWDFGDGDSAFTQFPTHLYQQPGMYDVTLEIQTQADTLAMTYPNFIIALADTIIADTNSGGPGETVEIVLSANNTAPLQYIKIPIEYPGNLNIFLDSFSTTGCRTDYFETQEFLHFDPFFKRFTIKLLSSYFGTSPDLPPGSGDIVKLYFKIHSSATSGQSASIIMDGYNEYLPEFQGVFLNYQIASIAGEISVSGVDCFLRGDIDNNGTVDIADLVYFVEYSFNDGPPPELPEHADVNCSGTIDIADIVYIVEYMFGDGPEPCGC